MHEEKETRGFVVRVKHRRRVPASEGTGFTTEPLPDTDETVEITVDWAALARTIGVKACESKSGRSALQGGIIVARHRRKK